MVHIASTLLLALTFAATGICTPAKRTVDEVKADIATISAQVTKLDNAITLFPATGGLLGSALTIHSNAVALVSSLKKGTTDVTATGPLDDVDGQDILSSVNAFEPTIEHALVGIVEKKAAFQRLPVKGIPALVLQDLKDLSGNTTAFSDALIANAPDSLKDQANDLKNKIVAGFEIAIAAYQS